MHAIKKLLLKYVWSISAKKISFIRTCDREEIKATDCIIKVFITSGNIKWRSFALRFCASNHKSAWRPLLPSAKGLSFTSIFYHFTRVMVIITFPFYTFSFGNTTKKNTLPWWYVFVTVGHVFCHACTSMKNLWQNQDSHTYGVGTSVPWHYQNYHHGSVHFYDDKSRVIEVLSSRVTDTWHPP